MSALNERILVVQDRIPREFRKAVSVAAGFSDGTVLSFEQELSSQVWDYPELPVQDIMDLIAYDL